MRQQLPILLVTSVVALATGCSVGGQLGMPSLTTTSTSPRGARAPATRFLTVPDVKGLSEADAVAKLRSVGITGNIEVKRPSQAGKVHMSITGCAWNSSGLPSKYADGAVCFQNPYANKRSSTRLSVRLELAERTSYVAMPMPNVVGMSAERAKRPLHRRGFKKIETQIVADKGCRPGIVCRQNIKPNKRAVFSLRKTLFVGRSKVEAKPDVKKPDVKKPDVKKPDVKKPDAKKPDAKKPDAKKPDAKDPDEKKPDENQPDAKKPDEKKPEKKPDDYF